jgi:hypothetical protein
MGRSFADDRLQGADAWRQGVAVAVDRAGQVGDERNAFVFGKVKVLHGLGMGSPATLM